MKKACFVLVTLVMLGGFFITTAEAGQLCWQVDFPTRPDFNGYVRVMASGGKWTRSLHGVLYVQGYWYWPISGNMATYSDRWILQLNTNLIDSYVGIAGAVTMDTLSGSGRYITIGSTNTTYDVTLTKISCKDLPAFVAP